MTTLFKPHLQHPIESFQDLLSYLLGGARPVDQWGIGVEMETLVLDADTGEAASFAKIEQLLELLEKSGDRQGIRETQRLIGLKGLLSSITLEPGGQLELSGELCPDLHCCSCGYQKYLDDITSLGRELGLFFCGLGVQPFTSLKNIGWVPKARYAIMGPYMLRTGDMGQRMMKQTAGIQVNLDFADENDCLTKMRLAMALAPLLYALFANSPIMEDRPTGFLSTRGEIWSRTDPDRTGLIERLFQDGAGLADYVEYALDVPMYFLFRNGDYLDLTGERFTFRRYLDEGYAGHRPIIGDWDLHLSTLFPEVRLRPQIEIRSADSLPPRFSLAVGALLKGLLYDAANRTAAWALVRDLAPETRRALYRNSWEKGLQAPFKAGRLRDLAVTLVTMAREGLQRQARLDEQGHDESIYLEAVTDIVASGVTLAERLAPRWQGSRTQKLAVLKEHSDFHDQQHFILK